LIDLSVDVRQRARAAHAIESWRPLRITEMLRPTEVESRPGRAAAACSCT